MESEPFLKVVFNEAGYGLPVSVLKEIWDYTSGLFTEKTVGDVADCFEASTIVVGFTPEERAELVDFHSADIWPNVQGGTPVAAWRSDIEQVLYVMPDGSFEWTEP